MKEIRKLLHFVKPYWKLAALSLVLLTLVVFIDLQARPHGPPVLAVFLARLFQRVRFAEHIGQIKQLLACGGVPVLGRGRR